MLSAGPEEVPGTGAVGVSGFDPEAAPAAAAAACPFVGAAGAVGSLLLSMT